MLRWLMRKQLEKFGKTFDYDVGYMLDMVEVSPKAARLFGGIAKFAHFHRGAPKAALYAAGLTATLAEDCGPCTQLGVTMAEREGVPPEVLKGILTGDAALMGPDADLAVRFTRAALAHDANADDLRQVVLDRWGPEAVISLAFAMAGARVFPTVKYALGHGQACTRVRVGGEDTAPRAPAAEAMSRAAA